MSTAGRGPCSCALGREIARRKEELGTGSLARVSVSSKKMAGQGPSQMVGVRGSPEGWQGHGTCSPHWCLLFSYLLFRGELVRFNILKLPEKFVSYNGFLLVVNFNEMGRKKEKTFLLLLKLSRRLNTAEKKETV